MKKRIISLIMILLLLLTVSGCSFLSINSTTTKDNQTTTLKEESTTKKEESSTTIEIVTTTEESGSTTEDPGTTTEDPGTTTEDSSSVTEDPGTTTEHTHTWDEGRITTNPTCTTKGVKTYTCSCGETRTEEINALGHDLVEDAAVAATCTTQGKEAGHHCSRCDYTDGGATIAALGHTEVVDPAVAATCSRTGLTEGSHCSVCNQVIIKQEVVSKVDHTYTLTSSVDATCTTSGSMVYTCSACGDTKTEAIAALGHNYINQDDNIEATCFEAGKTSKICSRCGDTIYEEVTKASHHYENGYCTGCGIPYIAYLDNTFGSNLDLYTNDEENPYGIDLDKYGSDVIVMFYTPTLNSDPYTSVNTNSFYSTYTIATTYEDSYYRTQHHLMSGDISNSGLNYYPSQEDAIYQSSKYARITTAVYILSTDGDYLAYIPNSDTMDRAIFYGGAYISMNDVASYLLAFGEVPANSKYTSSQKTNAVNDWGIYGRCNNTSFSGDIVKYPYEPELPYILDSSSRFNGPRRTYYETDFGALGGFTCESGSITTNYNTGSTINRNVCRFVFVCDQDVTSIDDRYVFYTYNHYNDFQEYLNHDNAWGLRFGNCTGGGEYNSKTNYSPTQYPQTQYRDTFNGFIKASNHKQSSTGGNGGSGNTGNENHDSLTATLSFSGTVTTNMTPSGNAESVNLDPVVFNVDADKGGNGNFPGLNKAGHIRLYASSGNGNTITISVNSGYVIDSIEINFGGTISDLSINGGESFSPTANGSKTVNVSSTSVSLKNVGTAQCYIVSIVITYHMA